MKQENLGTPKFAFSQELKLAEKAGQKRSISATTLFWTACLPVACYDAELQFFEHDMPIEPANVRRNRSDFNVPSSVRL